MKYFWAAVILFILPQISFGQLTYTPLAPIAGVDSTNFFTYLSSIIKVIIGATGFIAVVKIVICGFKLLASPSPAARTEAKNCLIISILGLLIAFSAFLILQTINPELLAQKSSPALANAPLAATSTGPSTTECVNGVPNTVFSKNAEDAARVALCGNATCATTPIRVNAAYCANTCSQGCTNVQGLPNSAINIIKLLRTTISGDIVITGGTEYHLHVSHGANSPIFDLRKSAPLDALLRSSPSAPSFNGYTKYRWNGFWFTNEGDHWHACQVGTNATAGCN